ncbi:hypothetical protein CEXT_231081 [Caerostris extrusa]|uniref:Uncharacterized protein n=1 Tax=Caerostris extrusa TaxID=172846 RepID=A0AAV4S182_CAEEX|nr:hypothetical protein CEXT_231081 [Caerostris extrusa]
MITESLSKADRVSSDDESRFHVPTIDEVTIIIVVTESDLLDNHRRNTGQIAKEYKVYNISYKKPSAYDIKKPRGNEASDITDDFPTASSSKLKKL